MAAAALAQHYVEYISSPTVLLTIAVLVAPVLFTLISDRILSPPKEVHTGVPGCRRVGLRGRSNLHDQYQTPTTKYDPRPRVQALFTYPIKSCRGVELGLSQVEPLGLSCDRLFTFAQLVSRTDGAKSQAADSSESTRDEEREWNFMTERDFSRLVLLQTELWVPQPRTGQPTAPAAGTKKAKSNGQTSNVRQRERSRTRGTTAVGGAGRGVPDGNRAPPPKGGYFANNGGCLVVRFPVKSSFNSFGMPAKSVTIQIPLQPTPERAEAKKYTLENVHVWKDYPQAINVTNEIAADALDALRSFLGMSNPLALFRVDNRHLRPITRCLPKGASGQSFKVGFADAFPINLINLSSIRDVGRAMPDTASAKGKLDARRFRANVYISGVPPYAEDQWKSITLGHRIGRDKQGLFETEGEYHVACRTARCGLPNVDPDTGVKDRNEPYATMKTTRVVDEGAKPHPCLGMQMIPLFQRGVVRVGDEVQVLEVGEHVYEKMLV